MRRRLMTGLIAGLIPFCTPATATPAGEAKLQHFLAGRVAGRQIDCILPDFSVPAEIYEGAGIVYRDRRTTYVARMQGACPALREDRIIVTHGLGGRLCRNDEVRIAEPTGAGFGFCTIAGFTPYAKSR